MEVRQSVHCAGGPHRGEIGCVETEEIHARNIFITNISSDIEFGETVQPGQRRHEASANAAHPEGNYAHVSLSAKQIKLKLRRNQSAQAFGRKRPVREQEIVPLLGG